MASRFRMKTFLAVLLSLLLLAAACQAATDETSGPELGPWLRERGFSSFKSKLQDFGASTALDLRFLEAADLEELGMDARQVSDFQIAVRDHLPALKEENPESDDAADALEDKDIDALMSTLTMEDRSRVQAMSLKDAIALMRKEAPENNVDDSRIADFEAQIEKLTKSGLDIEKTTLPDLMELSKSAGASREAAIKKLIQDGKMDARSINFDFAALMGKIADGKGGALGRMLGFDDKGRLAAAAGSADRDADGGGAVAAAGAAGGGRRIGKPDVEGLTAFLKARGVDPRRTSLKEVKEAFAELYKAIEGSEKKENEAKPLDPAYWGMRERIIELFKERQDDEHTGEAAVKTVDYMLSRYVEAGDDVVDMFMEAVEDQSEALRQESRYWCVKQRHLKACSVVVVLAGEDAANAQFTHDEIAAAQAQVDAAARAGRQQKQGDKDEL